MTVDDSEESTRSEDSAREPEVIAEFAELLNASVKLDEALDGVLDGVARFLGLETGWIWLLDEDGDFYLAAARNLPPGFEENPGWKRGNCYCQQVFSNDELSSAENVDVLTCSRLGDLEEGRAGLEYHASVPIAAEDTRLGILNLASADSEPPSNDELRLLRTVSDMLGVAVRRTRLFARSRRLGALEERHRVARDIHDTLAQKLVAVTLQLETADAFAESDDESVPGAISDAVEQSLELSRSALEDTRRSVANLSAKPLDGRSVVEALDDLTAEWDEESEADVTFEPPEGWPRVDERLEVGLFRIAEEALRNAAAHADADKIAVELTVDADRVELTVADDGAGFDPDEVDPERFGLQGMGERIRRLDGKLVVDTAPGAGTRIRAVAPREAT